MKKTLILLTSICISYFSNAQSSTVDEIQNEFLPSMNSSQRTTLATFESLRVIDTDDQRTWIFKNGKWQREFSDEAILQAKTSQDEKLKSSASWKQFDELSRPENSKPELNVISSVENTNINSLVTSKLIFRYEVLTSKDLVSNSFQIKPKIGEKITFIKVFSNDLTNIDIDGFAHFATKEVNSMLITPLGIESNTINCSLIKISNNNTSPINSENLKGILVAYTK